jgi:hypothetical protein
MNAKKQNKTFTQSSSNDTLRNNGKSLAAPKGDINFTIQQKQTPAKNTTGLPDNLKRGIEHLSGIDISDVKVHYNSSQPAQLNAHAYAQGNQIHIAPGQQKHLAHEAWHVVQQKQGRVKPTMQMKSKVNINDDKGLETEADVMGNRAYQMKTSKQYKTKPSLSHYSVDKQFSIGFKQLPMQLMHGPVAVPVPAPIVVPDESWWEGWVKGKKSKPAMALVLSKIIYDNAIATANADYSGATNNWVWGASLFGYLPTMLFTILKSYYTDGGKLKQFGLLVSDALIMAGTISITNAGTEMASGKGKDHITLLKQAGWGCIAAGMALKGLVYALRGIGSFIGRVVDAVSAH